MNGGAEDGIPDDLFWFTRLGWTVIIVASPLKRALGFIDACVMARYIGGTTVYENSSMGLFDVRLASPMSMSGGDDG
jgi:hypothetical protein